ncbi:MAG: homing endonuclease associated repeat-containing protein [Verrucomicrobiia bacterium]
MADQTPPLSKQALTDMIAAAARALDLVRLPRRTFLKYSGLSSWAVDKHFDNWSDACRAAGIDHGCSVAEQPRKLGPTPEECVDELKRVASLLGATALSSAQYNNYARISAGIVSRRFGGWPSALATAGLTSTTAAERQRPLTKEECIQELQRVAQMLGRSHLTTSEFDAHRGNVSAFRIVRVFETWHAALEAAGLTPSPNFIREVPISTLADDFLGACVDLGRIPTIIQLTRRSRHVSHTFGSGKPGGYGAFKRAAIEHLFSNHTRMPPAIKTLLQTELLRLPTGGASSPDTRQAQPHRQGRTLNFRAFVYTPTCEHDVVQMFGAVAHDLGFEIIGNRSAFPDCEARRSRPGARETFVQCLIEYEYASSDYRKHKHPVTGCDLVVCWTHDWADCPIEVLDLSSAIKKLDGWQ